MLLDAAGQAGRILKAWNLADSSGFEAELQSALTLCATKTPASELESERQAVLQSVVQLFRQTRAPQRLEAGLFLLRHLRQGA